MRRDDLLKKARAIREQEHRLKPSLRLKTFEEILDFIHSKGLVSVLGGNELPSFISAALGRPWKPTGKGFTGWLDWWSLEISDRTIPRWISEIERRYDMLAARIFRRHKTFVSNTTWPILDPIIRHYRDLADQHKILSQAEWNILQILEKKGPTRTDRMRAMLRLKGKQHTSKFHRSLTQLENHGLIVGYEDPKPEKHLHAAIWHLWGQRVSLKEKSDLPYEKAVSELLEKTLDACLFAREQEVTEWFVWDNELAKARDKLVANGRILQAEPYLFAPRIAG